MWRAGVHILLATTTFLMCTDKTSSTNFLLFKRAKLHTVLTYMWLLMIDVDQTFTDDLICKSISGKTDGPAVNHHSSAPNLLQQTMLVLFLS